MSTNDYQRVHNTRLSDLDSLPPELVRRYLVTCPAPVRVQLLRTLIDRRTGPLAPASDALTASPDPSVTARSSSDQAAPVVALAPPPLS